MAIFLLVPRLLDNPGVLQKALGSKEEEWSLHIRAVCARYGMIRLK